MSRKTGVYERGQAARWTEEKETMNEKRGGGEIDPVSNVHALKQPGECAELRLMVDIKNPRKRGRIDARPVLRVEDAMISLRRPITSVETTRWYSTWKPS